MQYDLKVYFLGSILLDSGLMWSSILYFFSSNRSSDSESESEDIARGKECMFATLITFYSLLSTDGGFDLDIVGSGSKGIKGFCLPRSSSIT